MKISAIVLSALISFSALAQTPKQKEGDKPKTTTTTKEGKTSKAKQDSVKVSKGKEKGIGPDYCPPCGMG